MLMDYLNLNLLKAISLNNMNLEIDLFEYCIYLLCQI